MSVTSSTDPVQTVLDVLQATSDSDWTGVKPTHIERVEDSPRKLKENRVEEDAVYVWSPAEGDFPPASAGVDDYLDVQVVQCDAWAAPETSRGAGEIAGDIRSYVASNFWRDRKQQTVWNEIAPDSEDDRRASQRARGSDHEVVAVQLRLERRVDT